MKRINKVGLRQNAIKTLIQEYEVENQDDLVQLLADKCSIFANQSVVSRDLRELGVVKRLVKDKALYELPSLDVSQEILRLAVVDVCYNTSLVVVKTLQGMAAFVSDFLDTEADRIGILGTLAGENTVFVTPQSAEKIKDFYEKVCLALAFRKSVEEN